MRRFARLLSAVSLSLAVAAPLCAAGGEYNEVLSIGDAAPAWSDLPGVDDRRHSLADLADKEAVVVIFTCNSCPAAVDYEDRIIAFAEKHAGPESRVAVVAINVNTIEEDRLDKMKERATSKGFPFPYLYDESQDIARRYGAIFTPEFFILDRQRKIAYMGGMDNSSQPQGVTENYLEPALVAVLQGEKPAIEETVARGCRIRYNRTRRR